MLNRLFLLPLLFCFSVAGPLHAATTEPYEGSRIFWDPATRHTVFSSGGYARILQLQDGRLMAVCESSGIKASFSSNGGATWTAARTIAPNASQLPNCVPDLIQLADGTIIVAYNPRPSSPYSAERRFGIRCRRSTDNGQSWSDEIFVNDADFTFNNGCWEPSMLELPSGELQLYFADEGPFTASDEQQISLCRSFDGGLTWSSAQRICFRAGFRDGMPVPVLLPASSEIVVAIEDNGWGYGDFLPTTVRTTLDDNWNSWVDANSDAREMALDLQFCPVAKGGAPYLRVLPWGETVLSHQSPLDNDGNIQMRVAVGDDGARKFKAVSTPFGQKGTNPQGLWNSLAVIDTGIVVAVSGINGCIEMIKGYPTRLLQAPFAHPIVDGRQRTTEGYFKKSASQIILGSQTGTRLTADFAYDLDSLYFTAKVTDNTRTEPSASKPDAVALMIDTEGSPTTRPQASAYRIVATPDGTIKFYSGSNTWRPITTDIVETIHVAKLNNSSYYLVEVAIPWSTLGCTSAPVGKRMTATVNLTDNQSGTILTEDIPDANELKPWTWMEFRLKELPVGIRDVRNNDNRSSMRSSAHQLYDLSGRPASSHARGLTILRRPDHSVLKLLVK